MKQGYLVIAQNTKDSDGKTIDYVRMAYDLLSASNTHKKVSITSCSGDQQRRCTNTLPMGI